jgi:hypothetical protein
VSARGPRALASAAFGTAVRPVYRRLRRTVTHVLFERRLGIETEGEIQLAELGLDSTDRSRYVATGWSVLPRILPRRSVGPEDVFVDFGSGMGRVVLQAAATYPLKRAIGVELSDELSEIARRNLERSRPNLRCRDVELVTTDVLEYRLPDDVTIAFFANPFKGEIFRAVINELVASVDRAPRRLRVVYRNPVEHDALMATGRARMVRKLRGWRPGAHWSRLNATYLYELESRPPAPAPAT